jgi:hypothetical protein
MGEISRAQREAVIQRARNRCEYCQLSAQFQVGGFEIDHLLPRSRGGLTALNNLALACPHCNAHKWAHIDGEAPASSQLVPLFHPRMHLWDEHFQWSEHNPFEIVGISVQGRATVSRLQMNHPDLVSIRRLLAELGLPWRLEA